LLRMLGVPFDAARELAHAPLSVAELPRTPLICATRRPTQTHSRPWGGCARRRAAAGCWRVTYRCRADPTTHTHDERPHSTTGLDLLGDRAGSGLPSTPTVQATAGTPPACRSRTCSRRRLGSQSPTGDRPYPSKNANSRARAGGEGRFRVRHCSADNSRITLSTYRLARGRRVHSSAVSSRQAARYSSEIRCRSATKLGSVPISEIS